MFYNDEFGYPIGMVGSEDIWMYYIDFNLDKKTAETGNEVNGKKSVSVSYTHLTLPTILLV